MSENSNTGSRSAGAGSDVKWEEGRSCAWCAGSEGELSFCVLSLRRLLRNPRMPRCRQFSEDRKEPSAGRSRGATRQLGDIARAENWRNPGGKKGSHPFLGVSSLGHHGRVRGPFPSRASLLSYSPFRGCSFVPPPISAPNSSRVTCAGFSTVSWMKHAHGGNG